MKSLGFHVAHFPRTRTSVAEVPAQLRGVELDHQAAEDQRQAQHRGQHDGQAQLGVGPAAGQHHGHGDHCQREVDQPQGGVGLHMPVGQVSGHGVRPREGGRGRVAQPYSVPVLTMGCVSLVGAQHDQQVADHGGLALVVELHDGALGQALERRLDHATAPCTILWRAADDGFGLLAAQHHLRDLGRIGQVAELGVLDHHAGVGEALLQFFAQARGGRSSPSAAWSRPGPGRRLVVGELRGHVADGGLGLHPDVVLEVVDLEHRLRAVVARARPPRR
jgi:hypothetical protein